MQLLNPSTKTAPSASPARIPAKLFFQAQSDTTSTKHKEFHQMKSHRKPFKAIANPPKPTLKPLTTHSKAKFYPAVAFRHTGTAHSRKLGIGTPFITKIYTVLHLHFQNFLRKLEVLAMPSSSTARLITLTTIIPVVSITVVVVSGPV
jgi:hypothetical protein